MEATTPIKWAEAKLFQTFCHTDVAVELTGMYSQRVCNYIAAAELNN